MIKSVKQELLINSSNVSLDESNVPKFMYYNTKSYLKDLLKLVNTSVKSTFLVSFDFFKMTPTECF